MKKYYFIALAALAALSSCSVEFNEDNCPASVVEKTFIQATIDQTKTTLGAPEDNVYPVEWVAGDQISVNGVASNALSPETIDGQYATFSFAESIEGDCYAVYPALACSFYSEGSALLDIPATQAYTPGSFDPAAAIMLGKGTVGGIEFSHAMAYLKVTVSGFAKINGLTVSAGGTEKLAGKFMTTFDGTLVPATGTTNSVSVTFNTSAQIGAPIIVAIPAQTYANGLKLSFQDTDGYVMDKASTGSFTAEAGKIYTTAIEYSPKLAKSVITIDGDLSDWNTASVLTYNLPAEDAMFTTIQSMKLTADDDNVYMLLEINEPNGPYPMPIDIFVDNDADPSTGGKLTSTDNTNTKLPYTDTGLGWYIEVGDIRVDGDFIDFSWGVYKYAGQDGAGIFSNLPNQTGNYTSDAIYAKGTSDDAGKSWMEIRFNKSYFGLAEKASFGVKLMDGNDNWNCLGLIPQVPSPNGKQQAADLGVIALDKVVNPIISDDPIIIDRDFSDWDNAEVATLNRTETQSLRVLKTIKYYADGQYMYVYMELEGAKQFGDIDDFNVMMDFYIDCDGNPATGGIRSDVFNHGVNWYFETFVGDANSFGTWNSGQYEYTGEDGGSIWSLNNHGGEYIVKTAGVYDDDNDFAQIEARFKRSDFKLTNTKAGFGMAILDGTEGWTIMGKLPQNDDLSMFVMDLPPYDAN